MKEKKQLATEIVRRLRRKGFAAYFAGGYVRDILMRKRPKDIDIATSARPAQIEKIFGALTHRVGAQFGTILVVRDNCPFQVSTFRSASAGYSSSLAEDVKARDFTINGLAYEPLKGEIIDLVEGRQDIRRKKIRAIGEPAARLKEDPLRLMRAVRLAVTLGFDIEVRTLQAIKTAANLIRRVKKERIRDELIAISTSSRPAEGLELLEATGLLQYVLPQVLRLKGVRQPPAFHPEGDVFTHTLLMLEQLKQPSLVLAFACLLHDIAKPLTFEVSDRIRFSGHDKLGAQMSDKILRELKFSNQDRESIVACVANHMRLMEAKKMREATLKRLFSRPTFEEELKLHYLDCLASHRDLTLWHFLRKKYRAFKQAPQIPPPLLNGYELINLGFTPGPIFGKIHRQMVDLQLEGRLKTKTEARKWVNKKFNPERSRTIKIKEKRIG